MAWDDIQGHELPKRILRRHLATGSVAPAYLLAGPEGIGKRLLALEMAQALICAHETPPCGTCGPCGQVARGTHPDLHQLAPSGTDRIKIEEIRQVIARISLRPYSAKRQVVFLNGAERLTEEAANSLLKTLEEPSARTHFLLTTAKLHRCLPTIISRCQVLRCAPLPQGTVEAILTRSGHCDAKTARAVARVAQGSVARGMRLAEQWSGRHSVTDRLATPDPDTWLSHPLPDTSEDVVAMLDAMMAWLRDVALHASQDDVPAEWNTQPGHEASVARQARRVSLDRCLDTAFALVDLRESVEQYVSPKLVAHLARERWLNLHAAR